jgi:GGDEF domain-containing protein
LLTQSVGAILVLGNRITEEEYTSNEFFFVKELMKKSSSVLRRIFEQTSAREQIEQLRQEQAFHNAISRFQQKVEKAQTVDHIKNLILEELNSHSVSCFLLFSYNLKEDGYSVILSQNESPECHVESFHGTIPASSPLVKGLSEIDGPLVIENSQDSPLLRDFSHNGILHNVHESKHYPVMAGNRIFGFLSTFNSNVLTSDQDERISQNLKHALQIMAALKNVSFKGVNFFDSVEIIYRRIEDELVHAREMDIPVTLVLFSIRNYKRFYHLNGLEELNILINEFEKIIQSRMSESDFSARFDRNKILLVLPGKDNKYAVPLANVVKSEISQLLESREKQILVSVLTAEFPSDADNLYDLIDAVD